MIAFTCGDPAGVGPEIIERWLAEHPGEAGGVAVIGPAPWLSRLPAAVSKIPVGIEAFDAIPGKPSGEGALVAWAAMEHAAIGCKDGTFEAVVTGPVSKEWLSRIGYEYPGQTEFFAARWGGEPTMAFSGGKLRVVLLSWHIPLREVPSRLTPEAFARAIGAADELARAEGVASPRIGICGLNPHAGEGGMLGREEIDIIEPILRHLRSKYPGVSRCEPSDTIFGRQLKGEFDVIVALYHDQGLAPLKAIDFDSAVNITLGLAHVRTSPDHGTAFAIAGKGIASTSSFSNAVTLARRLVDARKG
ncbi:MAG: 4-hydroxythreonine-4-phosphate dehydrogenase PdxA [Opitutaceae bacterium]|jgi:4-hydroxythreonine-4-phosphate dehydrogenase